jgi:hypothetical protein
MQPCLSYEYLHEQNDKISASAEFLQPYRFYAADSLLHGLISAVLSFDEHFSQTNTSVPQHFVTDWSVIILSGTHFSGCALLKMLNEQRQKIR